MAVCVVATVSIALGGPAHALDPGPDVSPSPSMTSTASAPPGSTWTWWHVVRGQWRSSERDGVEPVEGVERTAKGEDGRTVTHVVRDPGPGLLTDPNGDTTGGGRARDRRAVDITFVEARAEGTSALRVTTEVVGPKPPGRDVSVLYTWQFDTDGDDAPDHLIYITDLALDLVGHFEFATDTNRPIRALPIAYSLRDRMGSALVPLTLLGDPDIGAVRVLGEVSLCREDEAPCRPSDRGPDEGWLAPSGIDAAPDLLADAAPVYRAMAAGFDRGYRDAQRHESPDDVGSIIPLLWRAIDSLTPYAAIPEVGALVDALAHVEATATSLRANHADDLAFLVRWIMGRDVAPLADAVRARLGLPPRTDDAAL